MADLAVLRTTGRPPPSLMCPSKSQATNHGRVYVVKVLVLIGW
jgi:hypothetical protein